MRSTQPGTGTAVAPEPDFAAIFESLPELLLVLTCDPPLVAGGTDVLRELESAPRRWRVVTASEGYLRATRRNRAGVAGRDLFDLLTGLPDSPVAAAGRDRVRASLDGVLAGHREDVVEGTTSGASVPESCWRAVHSPVAGPDGGVRYIVRRLTAAAPHDELLEKVVWHVPAEVAVFDREMRYLQASERWCADNGLEAAAIRGRSHYDVIPDLPEHWREFHRRGLAGESLHGDEERWDRASGRSVWLRWEIRPWGGAGGSPGGILIFAEDVTARRGLEDSLKESAETIQALLENAAQAILAVDRQGAIVLANQSGARMFGYSREELAGTPMEMLIPEHLRAEHTARRAEFFDNPRSISLGQTREMRGLRKNGVEFPIEISLSSVQTGGRMLAVAFITDITGRKDADRSLRNSENELRALAGRLLTAQEDERRRIARDLHDDVTQRVALLSIEAGKLASALPLPEDEMRRRLRLIQAQALDVSDGVRHLSHGLHSSAIQDFGLSAVLEEACLELAEAEGIDVVFDGPPQKLGLSSDAALSLYRVAQECLRNAIKHADATRIEVSLASDGNTVRLEVRDDGAGFRPGRIEALSGLGLVSMKERMRLVGGTIVIHSEPGRGTRAVAAVPVEREIA